MRDALLGLHPKDFDVATNATPDEVRALFDNCRLIGRRFRLAHVRFGREIIETATFRAAANHAADDSQPMMMRAGSSAIMSMAAIDEDVWRRDFTCNALYYNIADFSIWDYTDGVKDVERRRLVLIGDPDTRLREDPVRMLRAVRFAAKLDFRIDKSVEEVHAQACRITGQRAGGSIVRRVHEDCFRPALLSETFDLLRQYQLVRTIIPCDGPGIERRF